MSVLPGAVTPARAVTLTGSDAFGTSSFNSVGLWNPPIAPSAGNAYFTGAFGLRTPDAAASFTFQGDSLEIDPGGTLVLKTTGAGNVITVNNLILDGGAIANGTGVGGALGTVAGGITVQNTSTLNADSNGRTIQMQASMVGPAGIIINSTNTAGGIISYDTVAKNYDGNTTINTNGVLRMGLANALASGAGKGDLIANGTLNINGFNTSINGLSGTGIVTNTGALATLSVGNDNDTADFAGTITGPMNVTKNGTGTQTFSGAGANTYTGLTTINDGILLLSKTAGINALTSDVQIGNGTGSDILRLGASNQIADNVVLTIAGPSSGNSGKFELNGFSDTVGGIVSNVAFSVIQNVESGSAAAATLGINSAANQTFAGLIRNGTGGVTSQLSINKLGAGTLTLTNNGNSYTGETILSGGILNVSSLSNYGVASAIGARTLAEENTSVTGIGLHFRGGTLQYTGATAQSTNRQIRILNGNGGTIDASGSNPAATLSFTQSGPNINLFDTQGARTLTLTGTNTGANTFAIQLTDQATNPTTLNKTGTGTWHLTNNASTYTGETIIGGGILNVSSLSNYGVASAIGARTLAQENAINNDGIGLHFRGGTLQYTGATAQSTNRHIRMLTGNGATIDASGSNAGATLSFTQTGPNINLFDTAGARTLTLTGTNTGANTFAIQLTDQATNDTNLNKTGTGTWHITNNANTYTGETIIGGGILNVSSLSDYGVASAIGARTLAEENTSVTGVGLHFRGGTLQYTGATAQSTDRHIRMLTGNGATIDASGSNPAATLSFTQTGPNINLFDTAGTRTLTLTGTNTGANTFAIQLTNQGANATSLAKSGTGTWVLTSNTSNYTGTTTVNAGTLLVNNTSGSGLGGSNVNVLGGATLGGTGGFTGAASFAALSTISPGGNGLLGDLETGSLSFATGAIYHYDFLGTASDVVNVTGNILFADELSIVLNSLDGNALVGGHTYTLFNYTGIDPTLPDDFDVTFLNIPSSDLRFRVDAANNAVVFDVIVPEPTTFALLGMTLVPMMMRRKRVMA